MTDQIKIVDILMQGLCALLNDKFGEDTEFEDKEVEPMWGRASAAHYVGFCYKFGGDEFGPEMLQEAIDNSRN